MEKLKIKKVGRPHIELTKEFIKKKKKWKNGEYKTTVQAIKESKTSKTTFYRFANILEQKEVQQ